MSRNAFLGDSSDVLVDQRFKVRDANILNILKRLHLRCSYDYSIRRRRETADLLYCAAVRRCREETL